MDFLNGLFLVGGVAALVPIIIHLVQRRRVQQVVFGSLRFLRKTSHRVVHRRRFEEILLVVLRALALAALAVAFARPFLPRARQTRVGGETVAGEGAALVLIDNSYSMRAEGRLERAKQKAIEFLGDVDASTKIGVAAYSSQFEELCPIGATLAQATEAIRGIEASWRGTKLDLALEQANRALTRAGRTEEARRIVLIGDFQEGSWKGREDWTLAPGIELTIHNVATRPVPNVFVGKPVVPRLVVAGGFVEVISATVHNLTEKPLNGATVALTIDGEPKGATNVTIRPGEQAPVRFRHTFPEPGDIVGTIAIEADDELPDDNVARFCVHVTPRVRILLVNGDREERMVLNDGLFVKAALAPRAEGVASPFEVREVAPEELAPADLEGVDVVLFANVSTLPAELTRVPAEHRGKEGGAFRSPLGEFVAAGGGIGFVCGSKVDPEAFNRTFGGLAPCKLLRPAMEAGAPPVVINQLDLRHELFAEFALPHSGDFSLPEFSQYFLVTDSLRARVPARFSSRDAHPALLELAFAEQTDAENGPDAKGRSILFVSSMDLEWNNLCLKSVFVPFVHQLAKRLCARRTGSVRNLTVSDEVTWHVPKEAGAVTLRQRTDAGAWGEPDELKAQPGAGAVSFSPEAPGIYELAYEGGSARLAANLDPQEPDLRPLDTRLLLSTVQRGPALEGERGSGTVSVVARLTAGERTENRQKVWRYLMLAVLGILAGEMALAARIGRA